MTFPVCTGKSRTSKKWGNTTIKWSKLVTRIASTTRTQETVKQYHAMSRDDQSAVKDVGGILCGELKHDRKSNDKLAGRKTKENILSRSIITLDIDECPEGFNPIELVREKMPGVEAIAYTTHKHTKEHPRWRLFIPMSEWVTPFYYEASARFVAKELCMEYMDKTTFQYNRLMYWPSTSIDGEYIFDRVKGMPVSPRKLFEAYPYLKKESAWPRHPDEDPVERRSPLHERDGEYSGGTKPATPSDKPDVVGAFCRAYSIEEAIDTFLSDVYAPQGLGRYTYIHGTSSGGLVVYEGQWAYSNHATDPAANGHDVNAFDLVRIHKFGHLDAKSGKTTLPGNLPSFKAMTDFVLADPKAGKLFSSEKQREAQTDFADIIDDEKMEKVVEVSGEPDFSWMDDLKMDGKGNYTKVLKNQKTILLNDPILSRIRYDAFHHVDVIDDPSLLNCRSPKVNDQMLWNISMHIQNVYKMDLKVDELQKAIEGIRDEHSYNPVHDYILSEKWDGEKRLDTVLIDYLGAPDTILVKAQTRCWFVGAVRRAFKPGSKFDYMLVLTGPQGVGKSQFLSIIADNGKFLDDSARLDMKDKELIEHLNSAWILEFAELSGMKSVRETEIVKSMLSQVKDFMREAYARFGKDFHRHCAMAATTNDTTFLSDTSARKFWVVPVTPARPFVEWSKELKANIAQIWAEAYAAYMDDEPNFLPHELEEAARIEQEKRNTAQDDPMLGVIIAYLDYTLPDGWRKKSREDRCNHIRTHTEDDIDLNLCIRRNAICAAEVKNELDYWFRQYDSRKSSQYVNRLLKFTGWELYKHGDQRYIDQVYGKQRNVWIRPGTDGGDVVIRQQEVHVSNAPTSRGFDEEDDDDL